MSPPFEETVPKPQNFGAVIARMTAILWRPSLARWRPRMALALIVTLVSKVLAVVAPVFLGDGINRVAAGEGAAAAAPSFIGFFLLFAAARFLSNGLPQARDAFFTRVT